MVEIDKPTFLYKHQGKYIPYWHTIYDYCSFCKVTPIFSTEIICVRYPLTTESLTDIRWFFCNEACFNCFIIQSPNFNFIESDWND